jgi:hypothetical protein
MKFHAILRVLAGVAAMLSVVAVLAGCAKSRTFTIYTTPAQAQARIAIDGVQRGPGPITQTVRFSGPNDVHHVRATAPGYEERGEDLWPDTPRDTVVLKLRPLGKRVVFTVSPVPGIVKVNGRPLNRSPVDHVEYALPADEPSAQYTVTAERDGYVTAQRTLKGGDSGGYYELRMAPSEGVSTAAMRPVEPGAGETGAPTTRSQQAQVDAPKPPAPPPPPQVPQPLKRDIVINTDPPNVRATIFVGGDEMGRNPVELLGHEFKRDRNGMPIPQEITASAPGFEGGSVVMKWDDGRGRYVVPLGRRKKNVRIITDPAGAVVTLEGKPMPPDRTGAAAATVMFPPTDPPGEPTTYTVQVAAPSDAWEPQEIRIGWDDGRQDYPVKLIAARTTKVALLRPALLWRDDGGWRAEARRVDAVAVRDVAEGDGRPPASRFAAGLGGAVPDSITVSPDGSRILFAALTSTDDGFLKSSFRMFNNDATPGPTLPSDGRSLDLTPSFTPDGSRIHFASNRGGGSGINVWTMSAVPDPGGGAAAAPRQISSSSNATLWPTVDSNPQPRLFYEAVLKGAAGQEGEGSEIHVVEMAAAPRTNMTLARGSQPRPSPRADSVIFTIADPATGNRDLYMVSDTENTTLGGDPVNLTNSPDVDECDAVWSRNGARLAFAANAGADETGRRNYDLYVMSVTGKDHKPVRVTFNGSWDDCPAWDPAGKSLYFRSNRGGQWGIWKIPAP